MRREEERAAPAKFTLHPDASAHHLRKPRANRQAQPRAAMLARRGSIRLPEGLKNRAVFVCRNADAGVTHRELERLAGPGALRCHHRDIEER